MGAYRSIRILLAGGSLVAGLLVVSRLASGLLAASAFVLGLFAIPVVVGVTLAFAWHAVELRRSVPGLTLPRRLRRQGVRTCLTCLERMRLEADRWVCPQCDHQDAVA